MPLWSTTMARRISGWRPTSSRIPVNSRGSRSIIVVAQGRIEDADLEVGRAAAGVDRMVVLGAGEQIEAAGERNEHQQAHPGRDAGREPLNLGQS